MEILRIVAPILGTITVAWIGYLGITSASKNARAAQNGAQRSEAAATLLEERGEMVVWLKEENEKKDERITECERRIETLEERDQMKEELLQWYRETFGGKTAKRRQKG